MATEEEILLQHSKEYYDLVKSSASMSLDELKVLSEKFDAAYFHEVCISPVNDYYLLQLRSLLCFTEIEFYDPYS